MSADERRTPPEKLSWKCEPEMFEFQSTAELEEPEKTIGQERALRSIEFGLGMVECGFNLYLAGETGTGRTSTIMDLLKKRAANEELPHDWCYVNNFKNQDNPISLSLPAGKGSDMEKDLNGLLRVVRNDIPKALQSKQYALDKTALILENQEKNNRLFAELDTEAMEKGFVLQRNASGLMMMPQIEGRSMTNEEYENLAPEIKARFDHAGNELKGRLADVLSMVVENDKLLREALAKLDRDLGISTIGHHIAPLKEKYADYPKVVSYLDDVQEDILLNMESFKGLESPPQLSPGPDATPLPLFERYVVNVFVDNSATRGAPVVYEANPTYHNLFGRIDHVMQAGGMATTNFTRIKPGALHKANGGYLVMSAREVLINPFAWEALKRCIRNSEIKIEDVMEQYRFLTIVSIKPEPVPLKAKIIMIGSPLIHHLLFSLEPDFRKLFKVKADFDNRVSRTPDVIRDYALFVSSHCREEKLLPFSNDALCGLLEYAARSVEDQERLSCQFMEISDLLREADFWARKEEKSFVDREIITRTIEEKVYRSNRIEERIQEMISEGTLLVDTAGSEVGQLNGLSVIQLGDYRFGRPSRVTARVYMGSGKMVNIEREVKLSGPIHDKGLLILTGYLGGKYAHDKPLSFSASICFEQSYDGVEGDSASSTELYALLSALSGVPLKQGIAVTGSVNQLGKVQPIGGVNHKIEGFFAVCKLQGLNGEQGVMIPRSNERNLMLKDEVIEAVREGKFHIWSVETIDQGIEILTGLPSGEQQPDGSYPEGSINYLVDRRLGELVEKMKNFSGAEEKPN
ncbi:MAG: AAA family ATPase [Desulfuromonadales bacterium]|nr:AAA family ATPase [Desulfuromonadales bacterium]